MFAHSSALGAGILLASSKAPAQGGRNLTIRPPAPSSCSIILMAPTRWPSPFRCLPVAEGPDRPRGPRGRQSVARQVSARRRSSGSLEAAVWNKLFPIRETLFLWLLLGHRAVLPAVCTQSDDHCPIATTMRHRSARRLSWRPPRAARGRSSVAFLPKFSNFPQLSHLLSFRSSSRAPKLLARRRNRRPPVIDRRPSANEPPQLVRAQPALVCRPIQSGAWLGNN